MHGVFSRLFLIVIILVGVASSTLYFVEADNRARFLKTAPVPLSIATATGLRLFWVEIAATRRERATGLMFRRQMADDHGMLFILPQETMARFWMKDTPISLDLIFIGKDRRIKTIGRGIAFARTIISPHEPVQFVLEVKAGTAAKLGIDVGNVVVHPALY